jgi:hypothetical protein
VLWLAWDAARHTLRPAVTLVDGFQDAAGDRWGRPVHAVAGPGGALYVSDDTAGGSTAWRRPADRAACAQW